MSILQRLRRRAPGPTGPDNAAPAPQPTAQTQPARDNRAPRPTEADARAASPDAFSVHDRADPAMGRGLQRAAAGELRPPSPQQSRAQRADAQQPLPAAAGSPDPARFASCHDPDALETTAWDAVSRGDPNTALAALRRAIQLAPDRGPHRDSFIQMCFTLGRTELLRDLVDRDPSAIQDIRVMADALGLGSELTDQIPLSVSPTEVCDITDALANEDFPRAAEIASRSPEHRDAAFRAAERLSPPLRALLAEALVARQVDVDVPTARFQAEAYAACDRWSEALRVGMYCLDFESQLDLIDALAAVQPRSAALRCAQLWLRNRNEPGAAAAEELLANLCERNGNWTVPLCASAAEWTPESPLPSLASRCLAKEPDAAALINALAAISFAAPAFKQAFWATVLEAYALGPEAATHSCLQPATEDTQCSACLDDIAKGQDVVRFSDACQATLCPECAALAIQSSDRGDTCGFDCACKTTRQAYLDLGLGAERANNLAARNAQRHLSAIPGWRACRTPDCFVGSPRRSDAGATAATHAEASDTDRAESSTTVPSCSYCCSDSDPRTAMRRELQMVEFLVENLTKPGKRHGEGVVRECYHCGVAGQKDDRCSTVTCRSCRREWDIVTGPELRHRFDDTAAPQRYIPLRGGLLRQHGFYDGVHPGAEKSAQVQRLVRNAPAWLAAKRQEIEDAPVETGTASAEASAVSITASVNAASSLNSMPELLFMPGDQICVRGTNGWWLPAVVVATQGRPPTHLRVRRRNDEAEGWVAVADVALWGSRPFWPGQLRRSDVVDVFVGPVPGWNVPWLDELLVGRAPDLTPPVPGFLRRPFDALTAPVRAMARPFYNALVDTTPDRDLRLPRAVTRRMRRLAQKQWRQAKVVGVNRSGNPLLSIVDGQGRHGDERRAKATAVHPTNTAPAGSMAGAATHADDMPAKLLPKCPK